jgi:hypothetical protein
MAGRHGKKTGDNGSSAKPCRKAAPRLVREQEGSVDGCDPEGGNNRAGDQEKGPHVIKEVGSEGLAACEGAERGTDDVKCPEAPEKQVHQECRLVEPVRIEITGSERHGAFDESQLISVIGEWKIVKQAVKSDGHGEGQQNAENCHG